MGVILPLFFTIIGAAAVACGAPVYVGVAVAGWGIFNSIVNYAYLVYCSECSERFGNILSWFRGHAHFPDIADPDRDTAWVWQVMYQWTCASVCRKAGKAAVETLIVTGASTRPLKL